MQAIEFETDVTSEYIRLPHYETLKNKHIRVIVLADDVAHAKKYNFSDLAGQLEWQGDALIEQQRLRNEWD